MKKENPTLKTMLNLAQSLNLKPDEFYILFEI